jgi:UDPglucose 6-dehydrogenase
LLAAGAEVATHDPVAMENVRAIYGDRVQFCEHHYDTLNGADALVICTEWPEFRNPDFDYLKHKLKQPLIFDGRNLWEARAMHDRGFVYHGIGLSSEQI